MLKIGDIRHAGITVRGFNGRSEEDAIDAAKTKIDEWQRGLEQSLPQGARLEPYHHVIRRGETTVVRYVTVVSAD